jgi:uncharacterized protein YllA (UPF0747 family)
MKGSVRHVPFRALGAGEMHVRFLEDDPDLVPMLGARAADVDDFLAKAPALDAAAADSAVRLDPAALGHALEAYARRHGAPTAVIENARRVGRGEARVVVTGQQPGLLGGPLYTLHKAATAIRLARDASARPGAPSVVPVFWNHSDDHDWDEVNRAFLVNPNQDLQRLRLDVANDGRAIRHVPVGDQLQEVVAAAMDMLPDTEFRSWTLDVFQPRGREEHLGDGLARLLFALFGRHGLLVIEPRDLPPEAFATLPDWWRRAETVRARTRDAVDHLGAIGLDSSIDPNTTLMFAIDEDGRRRGLVDGEDAPDATSLSPGVLLRPGWQDACLPSAGFVVGPGEIAYLAVVGRLYRELGVPRPVLVPRASLTLCEPSMAKHLARFGWDLVRLADGPERLIDVVGDEVEDDDVGGILDELVARLDADLKRVVESVQKTEGSLAGAVERVRSKTRSEIQKLAQRLRNAQRNRLGTGARQVRRLCNNLRPRGRLQERVLCPLPHLLMHGEALADVLIEAADPFAIEHGVVEL